MDTNQQEVLMEAIYKIYDLRKYYPNFVGMNSTAVVSDLTEEKLLLHCPELIRKQPFVLLTKTKWAEIKLVYESYNQNEEKHRIAALRHETKFGYHDGLTESFCECANDNPVEDTVFKRIALESLHSAIQLLTSTQKRRILQYYSGISLLEIAKQDDVCINAVVVSLKRAKKKIKENMEKGL